VTFKHRLGKHLTYRADFDSLVNPMRKTATKLTEVTIDKEKFYCVTWPKLDKGRNRRFFKSKAEGKAFLQQKLVEQQNYGTAGMAFTERQRAEYLECAEKLARFKVTLRDAVNFYLPHLEATNRTCTAAELVAELLKAKKADGASARYLSDLKSRLTHFSESFDGKPVAEITATDIDQWLRGLSDTETGNPLAPTTRNNFRRVLIVAFNFALDRGYCTGNPAAKTARAKQVEAAAGILTVEELSRLLENADNDLVPYIAIGAFAGLRRAELERLDWKEVDLADRLIEVTAKKAKSARRRFVEIKPNLAEWLKPYAKKQGRVTPVGYRKLLRKARKGAAIQLWPNNALRHSFASYHLAHFQRDGAGKLAGEMGHTNANLVFQHYRQLVKPKEARRYWSLTPTATDGKIVGFAKAA
jgi:integrase